MDAVDPFDLRRFVEAQASTYDAALRELKAGCKTSHWMWFIFPQLRGLGFSAASRFYGLSGPDEAAAYLAHPLLGARLRECVAAILGCGDSVADDILGVTDAMKFRSSMTLFAQAARGEALFAQALERFFGGEEDAKTIAMLRRRLES